MLSLIFSIRFWSKTHDRNRGIAAMVVSGLAALLSIIMYGLVGLIDVAILAVNVIIFMKVQSEGGFYC